MGDLEYCICMECKKHLGKQWCGGNVGLVCKWYSAVDSNFQDYVGAMRFDNCRDLVLRIYERLRNLAKDVLDFLFLLDTKRQLAEIGKNLSVEQEEELKRLEEKVFSELNKVIADG